MYGVCVFYAVYKLMSDYETVTETDRLTELITL